MEFLYASNSFSLSTDLEEVATVDYLSYVILPQRIAQIRDLYIYWQIDSFHYDLMNPSFNANIDSWHKSWTALSKITGLRRLHISLVYRKNHWLDYYNEMWKARGIELLSSIPNITAPRDFVITLPDRRCSTNTELLSPICILQLPATKAKDTASGVGHT